jgi:hypothetical protein
MYYRSIQHSFNLYHVTTILLRYLEETRALFRMNPVALTTRSCPGQNGCPIANEWSVPDSPASPPPKKKVFLQQSFPSRVQDEIVECTNKNLQHREKLQIFWEGELSSGNWQHQNNLRALTTVTLLCSGQLLFKGMFSCTVSDRFVLLMSRLTGDFSKSPRYQQYLACKPFHTEVSSGYEKIFLGFLRGRKVEKHSFTAWNSPLVKFPAV